MITNTSQSEPKHLPKVTVWGWPEHSVTLII